MIAKVKTKPQRKTEKQASTTVWMSSAEAAEHIGIKPQTLHNWRSTQKSGQPKFIKNPGRRGGVKYRKSDLDAWLESRMREF